MSDSVRPSSRRIPAAANSSWRSRPSSARSRMRGSRSTISTVWCATLGTTRPRRRS
ncbi:hypothetical protein R2601_03678 [Salipiger bermudensis HTCC2601]|uniref:Uncharacterized protein n=1 Tax=Salipiger bermudensis (strain DSM 26914 / JCM 13377 / KCTC 12554 / HTCC2601) TaxID=314265 RepID=Q0FWB0_SALBH|nr:hypothetical protein R2601_03678 [Salipiger bermudensis HTCC2601]